MFICDIVCITKSGMFFYKYDSENLVGVLHTGVDGVSFPTIRIIESYIIHKEQ